MTFKKFNEKQKELTRYESILKYLSNLLFSFLKY